MEKKMNEIQRMVRSLVTDTCCEYIGGNENVLLDYPEGSDEYIGAKLVLSLPHDTKVKEILTWVRTSNEWERINHLHFVSLDTIKEMIEKQLKEWDY